MSKNIIDIAKAYSEKGWAVIPLEPKGKKPKGTGWNKYDAVADDHKRFRSHDNVGVRLGDPSGGLVDADFDWEGGRKLADHLLSDLPSFGRASAKGGHRLFMTKSTEGLKSVKFLLPQSCANQSELPEEHARCVAEVRGNGAQTMFPGSTHPCGEQVVWETPDNMLPEVPEREYDMMLRRVGVIAFLAVVLRFYPASGGRDEMHMALAGTLAWLRLPAAEINRLQIVVAKLAGDEEAEKRGKGEAAVERLNNGEELMGLPKLVSMLGLPEDCTFTFRGWLGMQDAGSDQIVLHAGSPYSTAKKFRSVHYKDAMHHNGSYLAYTGSCYDETEEATVKSVLYGFLDKAVTSDGDTMKPFNPSSSKVSNVMDALKGVLHVETELYAPPCWLNEDGNKLLANEIIACQNGLLHLPSGQLLPATPNFFTRNALDYAYDQNAKPPKKWLKFLDSIWPDDTEAIEVLQEMFGYLLTTDVSQHKIFLIVGPPRSGKGTIARILNMVIGAKNATAPTLNALNDTFGMQSLIGKQLATISDMRIGNKSDAMAITENLLRISGEDWMTVNRKYKSEWQGYLSVRFVIMTNEVPHLSDNSGALAKRFVPLVMKNSFFGRENPNLTNELLGELPAILNWAIEGWKRLNKRGHFVIPSSASSVLDSLSELASPISVFVDECCELGGDYSVRKEVLFEVWREWCETQGDMRSGTAITFGRNLMSLGGIESDRETAGDRKNIYTGIRLKSDPYSAF